MKRKIFVFIFMMTLCSLCFPGEKTFNSTFTYDLPFTHRPFDWPTSTPEEQGLDTYIFSHVNEKADELEFMYSLLVIRNGYLISEQYFNGRNKYSPFNLKSTSKSVIGALIGIALKENYLTSLDQKMMDFFPEYITSDLDPRKYDITIQHLLQMRAGYPYEYSTYPGTYNAVADLWLLSDPSPDKPPGYNERITGSNREYYEWPTSTPAEQGLDPYILSVAYKKADEFGFMYSLLVIRNGKLVAEQYFNGQHKHAANRIASATKSFVSALFGIALRENYLSSLEQKMMDFFPEYVDSNLDQRKYEISIRHLLQMRAGYLQDSNEGFWNEIKQTDDWMKFAIEYTLAADPGQAWDYSNASTIILSGIITKATGMSTLDFAKKHLFDPLNISIKRWNIAPPGYYTGYGGIYITPRNMARLGYLYLNKGFVDGKQILPAEWIEESIKRYSNEDEVVWFQRNFEEFGYGYLWWLAKAHGHEIYFASGHGGQQIVNIPDLNMIIVATAHAEVTGSESAYQINLVYNLIANYILPAADGNHEPPPYPPSGISGTRVENRSLLRTEYIDILKWESNPLNQGENIAKYRIYYYSDVSGTMTKVLLAEVNAGTSEYWHRNAPGGNPLTYGITSVNYDNRESVPSAITVR